MSRQNILLKKKNLVKGLTIVVIVVVVVIAVREVDEAFSLPHYLSPVTVAPQCLTSNKPPRPKFLSIYWIHRSCNSQLRLRIDIRKQRRRQLMNAAVVMDQIGATDSKRPSRSFESVSTSNNISRRQIVFLFILGKTNKMSMRDETTPLSVFSPNYQNSSATAPPHHAQIAETPPHGSCKQKKRIPFKMSEVLILPS